MTFRTFICEESVVVSGAVVSRVSLAVVSGAVAAVGENEARYA